MSKTNNQPLSDAASLKRRLHVFFLFSCVAFMFILFVIWQLKLGADGVLGLFNGVIDRNQPAALRDITTNEIVDQAITYDKIDHQVWVQAANSLTSFAVNQRPRSVDGLQIGSQVLAAAGDIGGDFASGLVVNPNSVALGGDTTGDYVASIVAGLGLQNTASGEGTTIALDVVVGDGISVGSDGIAVNVLSAGGLSVTNSGLSLLNTCGDDQMIKWGAAAGAWTCAADNDTNTTYDAGSGLMLSGTTFSVDSSVALFKTIDASLGTDPMADSLTDTLSLVGGNGVTVTGDSGADSLTFDINVANGGGLAFSGGALTLLNSCSSGQILKYSGSTWACAADNTANAGAYKQQLTGVDNVTVGSSLTPLLTNGSGVAQSLGITVTSGNEIAITATMEATTTVATGPITYVIIRDDNQDNDCATGGGDGTQIGGQMSTPLSVTGQNFTTSIHFADSAPVSTTSYYQLCASTTIALGTTSVTDRALRLSEISL